MALPSLDAHAHIDARLHHRSLDRAGIVLAQTVSLDEAERSVDRTEANVVWGVGCHPRLAAAQAAFDPRRYEKLLDRTPVAGEIGLEATARTPWRAQLNTFRAILDLLAERPRLASIHSHRTGRQVLEELRRRRIVAPILHRWAGTAEETSEAVELGCYFSVHPAVARRATWRTRVPLDAILIESDHGWRDPPAAIPHRIGWVEHLLAEHYRLSPAEVRHASWKNFASLVEVTQTEPMLPPNARQILGRLRDHPQPAQPG